MGLRTSPGMPRQVTFTVLRQVVERLHLTKAWESIGLDSGPTWTASAPAGGVTNRTVTFTEAQEVDLLAGKFYLNIHTATNGGGEIRGSLVIPETSSVVLGAVGMLGLLVRKRR